MFLLGNFTYHELLVPPELGPYWVYLKLHNVKPLLYAQYLVENKLGERKSD